MQALHLRRDQDSRGVIARALLGAGLPDGPWVTLRLGRVGMYGSSISGLARWTIDGEQRLRRFEPLNATLRSRP
jgi:hypothetical protein